MSKPPFCQSYEEAREAFLAGELQAWDGTRWEDIPKGATPFFSRRVEEYRRRPVFASEPEFLVRARVPEVPGQYTDWAFGTAEQVALFMWGRAFDEVQIFKRIRPTSCDIRQLEKDLGKA